MRIVFALKKIIFEVFFRIFCDKIKLIFAPSYGKRRMGKILPTFCLLFPAQIHTNTHVCAAAALRKSARGSEAKTDRALPKGKANNGNFC